VQKHTLSEVENWTFVWWQVVSGIFIPKIIRICSLFFKLQSKMSRVLFKTQCIGDYTLHVRVSEGFDIRWLVSQALAALSALSALGRWISPTSSSASYLPSSSSPWQQLPRRWSCDAGTTSASGSRLQPRRRPAAAAGTAADWRWGHRAEQASLTDWLSQHVVSVAQKQGVQTTQRTAHPFPASEGLDRADTNIMQ